MLFEGVLCICCMSTEKLVDLYSKDNNLLIEYFNILESCLNIELAEIRHLDCYICKYCMSQLQNYIDFKKKSIQNISKLTSKKITDFLSEKDYSIYHIEENNVNKSIKNTTEDINSTISLYEHSTITPENFLTINLEERPLITVEECPTRSLKDFPTKTLKVNPKITVEEKSKITLEKLKETLESIHSTKPKTKFVKKQLHSEDTKIEMPYKIDKNELKCRECNAEFCTNFKLKRHYTLHFKSYNCAKCIKSFTSATSLAKHQVAHFVRKYDCRDCDKIFKNKNSLHTHRRTKHGTALPFKCNQCGQRFRTYVLLTVHQAEVHGIIKKYKCDKCDASFLHGYHLSKHTSRTHDDKTYSCNICGLTTQRELLQQHVKRMHSIQEQQNNKKRRFICKLCNKAFSQKITLQNHIKTYLCDAYYDGELKDFMIVRDKANMTNKGLLEGIKSPEENTEEELSEEEEVIMDFSDNINDFIFDDEQLCEIIEQDLDVIDDRDHCGE